MNIRRQDMKRCAAVLVLGLAAPCAGAQQPPAETPSAVLREVVRELFNAGDLAVAERRFAPAMAQEERNFTVALRRAFPDLQLTLDRVIEQGDWVAVRWTARGTHGGSFAGVAATGRRVSWGGAWFWRVEGGLIVDGKSFNVWDRAGLLEQLTRAPKDAR